MRLAEPDNPAAGLLFDGRTAENFKLSSGTWVNVGTLRTAVIAAGAPVIEDAVVTGHDRDEIGLLIFPSLAGLRGLCPDAGADARLDVLIAEPAVRRALVDGLARHNARAQGSSMRIARCLLLTEPPSIDANEITDKGYLNQRAVLTKRAALVERLHADAGGAGRDRDRLRRTRKRPLSCCRAFGNRANQFTEVSRWTGGQAYRSEPVFLSSIHHEILKAGIVLGVVLASIV